MDLEGVNCNSIDDDEAAFKFIIYDTISATPYSSSSDTNFISHHQHNNYYLLNTCSSSSTSIMKKKQHQQQGMLMMRKKRRRKARVCKNKEEAETRRMTHIVVERNRRKQMNEHLAILRSLMPHSYVQRGDQASIVGGAIEFVKQLEHLLNSLQAQKHLRLFHNTHAADAAAAVTTTSTVVPTTPFPKLLGCPSQYTWPPSPSSSSLITNNKYTSKSKAGTADVEVTLIESHANLKILSRTIISGSTHISKLVAGIQSLQLTILHLTLNTIHYPFILYSISLKIEESGLLSSVDDIAAAIHHMLRVIEETAAPKLASFC